VIIFNHGGDEMTGIKEMRLKKGWSQQELAKRSGVSQSHIHYLESGTKDATSTTLRKLAQALGVSVAELLEEENQSA
jgi:transcriptional regulator with XRE-family HTH domain